LVPAVSVGQDRDRRIAELETQLAEAKVSIALLEKTVATLTTAVQALHQDDHRWSNDHPAENPKAEDKPDASQEFAERIIGAENGSNEHDSELKAKPETFIQTRYSAAPIDGSGTAFNPNLRLSRIETRWAGKINDRLGAGVEIQFQESVEGSPEKLVNDAFLEYYLTDHATVRAGQFIKPFGFTIQQSSWL